MSILTYRDTCSENDARDLYTICNDPHAIIKPINMTPSDGVPPCPDDEFTCADHATTSGEKCVWPEYVCDGGAPDCDDGSDEANCGEDSCPTLHYKYK